MAHSWRTVRVFISSTFRDMHAERDYLVRVVFPELKERCRKRHVQLIDVDLRWGVTEEQAEGGGALDICLDEIDSCRPYFLGLLGHRYGYIPPGHDHSITAEEVYHGVLHKYLPRQILNLRPIVEGILEGRTLLKEQVSCLMRSYQWDANKGKYLLQKDIPLGDKEMLNSIFAGYSIYQRDRSFFFFRSASFTKELAGSNTKDYFEIDKALEDNLLKLKQEIIDAGLPYFEYDDLEVFGQKVLETLWGRIDAEFPEKWEEIGRGWLEEELELHELFMADRTRRFVGRSDIIKEMHGFVEDDSEPRLIVITGEPGCGKSALMARFTEQAGYRHHDWLILSHFVGASPSSTSLRLALRRFCAQLNRALGVEEEVNEEYRELAQLFPEFLQRASETRRILIIIDALNQFERTDNAHTMRWLPQNLPQNVKVVVSTLSGEVLDNLKAWHIQPRFEQLSGLTEKEIKEFVTIYLGEIRKEFPTPKIRDAFYDKIKAGNPLFIMVALEELKIFPLYEELGKRVASLPDTVPELFDQVLERIEGDFNRPLVQDFTSLIACGRQGMTAEELQTLLKGHAAMLGKDCPPAKLPDMVFSRLLRAFTISSYLFERSGIIDFFHGQLKEAVGKRYMDEEDDRDKVHQVIADYFEQRWQEPYLRALDELPHQLSKAKNWEGIEKVLCDLHFIEAKCAAQMTYQLLADYDSLGVGQSRPGPPIRTACGHNGKYGVQCPFCLAWSNVASEQLGELITCPDCQSSLSLNAFTIEAEWHPTPAQRAVRRPEKVHTSEVLSQVGEFADFVRSRSHVIIRRPDLVIQEACNFAASGTVNESAKLILKNHPLAHNTWARLLNRPRKTLNACLQTLKGGGDFIAVTPDGHHLVTQNKDGPLEVWDLTTGTRLLTIDEYKNHACNGQITPDSRYVVLGNKDGTIEVWDLVTSSRLRTLKGCSWHNIQPWNVNPIAITPDSCYVVATDRDGNIKVWDIVLDVCSLTLEGHEGTLGPLAITPDGQHIVSGGRDGTVRIWSITSGVCVRTLLVGHDNKDELNMPITDIAVTPDGRNVVCVCRRYIEVYRLATGQLVQTLKGNRFNINALAITPDARQLVTVGGDYQELTELIVFDIISGKSSSIFGLHAHHIHSVIITPDGRQAITLGGDQTIKVWDMPSLINYQMLKFDNIFEPLANIVPHANCAVTNNSDGSIQVWNLVTGELLRTINDYKDKAITAVVPLDDNRVITGNVDGEIKIWDLATGVCTKILKGHNCRVTALILAPDCRHVVSGDEYGRTKIWEITTGRCLHTLKGHRDEITAVTLTPEGRYILTGSRDMAVKVWNFDTGKLRHTLEKREWDKYWKDDEYASISAIAVTPNGSHVVTGAGFRGFSTIKIWDLKTGKCSQTLPSVNSIPGNIGMIGLMVPIRNIAITPDGYYIAVIGSNYTINVYELLARKCMKTLSGNTDIVFSVAMMYDGRHLVTGSGRTGKEIKVYDIDTGRELSCFFADSGIYECVVSSDNTRILAMGFDSVYIISLENIEPFPIIVTAWYSPIDETYAIGCPFCRIWSEISQSALGLELLCPNCSRCVKLNAFTINADWRPVAKAWSAIRT